MGWVVSFASVISWWIKQAPVGVSHDYASINNDILTPR